MTRKEEILTLELKICRTKERIRSFNDERDNCCMGEQFEEAEALAAQVSLLEEQIIMCQERLTAISSAPNPQ